MMACLESREEPCRHSRLPSEYAMPVVKEGSQMIAVLSARGSLSVTRFQKVAKEAISICVCAW
jgi:hypothetical protein